MSRFWFQPTGGRKHQRVVFDDVVSALDELVRDCELGNRAADVAQSLLKAGLLGATDVVEAFVQVETRSGEQCERVVVRCVHHDDRPFVDRGTFRPHPHWGPAWGSFVKSKTKDQSPDQGDAGMTSAQPNVIPTGSARDDAGDVDRCAHIDLDIEHK